MTNPIYTYNHANRDACVIGGFVYRGTQFPADYPGHLHLRRLLTALVQAADARRQWALDRRRELHSGRRHAGRDPERRAGGGDQGPDGSLYYVDNGPFQANQAGSIRRVRNLNANQPPTAVASADVTSGNTAPLTVHFSSGGSSDPEGQPLTYRWDFGDAGTSTAANPTHTYNARGRYTVRLTTSDGSSSTASNPFTITVGRAPIPTIAAPLDGAHFRAGTRSTSPARPRDPEDGTIPNSGLSWKVVFHHLNHIHPFIDSSPGGTGSFVVPAAGHSFHETTWYELILTARDSDGSRRSNP